MYLQCIGLTGARSKPGCILGPDADRAGPDAWDIGPQAEGCRAAFDEGKGFWYQPISVDGVALAAIQGHSQKHGHEEAYIDVSCSEQPILYIWPQILIRLHAGSYSIARPLQLRRVGGWD